MQRRAFFEHTTPPKWAKWTALLLIQLSTFNHHFSFDNLQALETPILTNFNLNLAEYNFLYSITDLPSLFFPLLVQGFADSKGTGWVLWFMTSVVCFGQLVVALAGYLDSYYLLLLGRFIYGCLLESQLVVTQMTLHWWFKMSEYSFAISLQPFMMGVAKCLNSYFVPRIYQSTESIGQTLFICFLICSGSAVTSFFYYLLEKKYFGTPKRADSEIELAHLRQQRKQEKREYLSQVLDFKLPFWLLVLNYCFVSGAFFGYTDVVNDFIHRRYQLTSGEAGELVMVLYVIITILSPIMGEIATIGHTHKNTLLIFSNGFLVIGQAALIYFEGNPKMDAVVPMVFFGLFWGSYQPLIYPLIRDSIRRKKYVGLAYGIASVLHCFGILLMPLVGASISDYYAENKEINYLVYTYFLLGLSVIALILAIATFFVVWRNQKRRRPSYFEAVEETVAIENTESVTNN